METQTESTKKGNGGNVKSAIKGRSFKKSDMVELCVLATYMVQSLGRASVHEVLGYMKKAWNSKAHINTLSKALENCRAKEHLGAVFGPDGERVYQMQKLKYADGIEVAHVDTVEGLISTLLNDPAGMAIKAEIEAELGQNASGKPNKDVFKGEDWAIYTVVFELVTEWLGGAPIDGSIAHREAWEKSKIRVKGVPGNNLEKLDPATAFNTFHRIGENTLVAARQCQIVNFLGRHLKHIARSPFHAAQYFGITPILFETEEITTVFPPVINERGQGVGRSLYECLVPGTRLTWEFTAPTVNYLLPEQMEKFIRHALKFPTWSMSPGRGTATGSARLISIEHEMFPSEFLSGWNSSKTKKS